MNKKLYFAYGMNTNIKQMKLRCPQAKSLGAALLPEHKFRFDVHGDVVLDKDSQAHGVLWEITDQCEQNLDTLEGWPTYYEKKTVKVIHRGQIKEAMVYYMTGSNFMDSLPSQSYLDCLIEGYLDHGIELKQLSQALENVVNDYGNIYPADKHLVADHAVKV